MRLSKRHDMTVITLVHNEFLCKSTPTRDVGKQKEMQSSFPPASSAAFAATACKSAAVLAAATGLTKLAFLRLVV